MANQSRPQPHFDKPPVVETIFGVHFEPLDGFTVDQRVLFWSDFRDEFPKVEEKPPFPQQVEQFGEALVAPGSQILWEVSGQVLSPRLWAKSQDGKHTLQIQHDAILTNWERDEGQSTEPYIPYAKRREGFARRLSALHQFLQRNRIGELTPLSCLVTYINHIDVQGPADFASGVERVFACWKNETSDGWLPKVERGRVDCSFLMPEEQGRLHVNLLPALRHRDKRHILRLDITARGTPTSKTVDGALDWIDRGHEWVVRGFASLTRPEMHKLWGRTQ